MLGTSPSTTRSSPADVIIVLGAPVRPGGRPSAALRRRVRHGVRLHRQGHGANIILTGGVGRYPPAEAVVMAEVAAAEGAPRDHLFLEDQARNTLENALNSIAIMSAHGWSTAIVVTDSYHLRRGLMTFRRLGVDVTGSASAEGAEPSRLPVQVYWQVRELAALPWYALRLALLRRSLRRS